MKSDHVTKQESKESKIFEFFSAKLGLPRIETGPKGKYPDGILELDGKLIAIEQTDFYLIKHNGRSCNMAFLSCLQSIRHNLELKDYTGCIGVKPKYGAIRKDTKRIKPQLEEEIRRYIDGDTSIQDISELIECIEYCPNRNPGKLIIKPYVCDIDGAIVFCEYINPELVLQAGKEPPAEPGLSW